MPSACWPGSEALGPLGPRASRRAIEPSLAAPSAPLAGSRGRAALCVGRATAAVIVESGRRDWHGLQPQARPPLPRPVTSRGLRRLGERSVQQIASEARVCRRRGDGRLLRWPAHGDAARRRDRASPTRRVGGAGCLSGGGCTWTGLWSRSFAGGSRPDRRSPTSTPPSRPGRSTRSRRCTCRRVTERPARVPRSSSAVAPERPDEAMADALPSAGRARRDVAGPAIRSAAPASGRCAPRGARARSSPGRPPPAARPRRSRTPRGRAARPGTAAA